MITPHTQHSSIWFKPYTISDILSFERGAFAQYLGIEFCEIGSNYLSGRLPLTDHLRQPFGVLHGGVSVSFAETLGSVAANFVVDRTRFRCVGQSISANHLRPVRVGTGMVFGTARPELLGTDRHIWSIELRREDRKLSCVATLTTAVIALEKR